MCPDFLFITQGLYSLPAQLYKWRMTYFMSISIIFFFISVPGIIGCLQALEAIKLASSVGVSLSGRMLLFDALSARIRTVRLLFFLSCLSF